MRLRKGAISPDWSRNGGHHHMKKEKIACVRQDVDAFFGLDLSPCS